MDNLNVLVDEVVKEKDKIRVCIKRMTSHLLEIKKNLRHVELNVNSAPEPIKSAIRIDEEQVVNNSRVIHILLKDIPNQIDRVKQKGNADYLPVLKEIGVAVSEIGTYNDYLRRVVSGISTADDPHHLFRVCVDHLMKVRKFSSKIKIL